MSILYLHMGLHKTGSSAIQKFLFDNANDLRREGILYPKTGLRGRAQHKLAWALFRNAEHMALWPRLRDEIADSGVSRVIVSSEEFEFLRTAERWARLRDELPFDVRIVCYLRRQDRVLTSTYNQHVKQGFRDELEKFIPKIINRLNYAKQLNCIESVFGRDNIIIRVYEKCQLPDGIYADFLRAVDIPPSLFRAPTGTVNPSLSPLGLQIMLSINRYVWDENLRKQLLWIVLKLASAKSFEDTDDLLSNEKRFKILKLFLDSNRYVARRYLGRNDGRLFYDD